ncbi:MAG: precorrin-6A reductase [Lachnospiraceae bacterium]|nr:precorrin-6A reductase [Lachnospiraceae bacterium]
MRIIIFSGTTEGRELSSMLDEKGIDHLVCVATEYGNEMTKKSEFSRISVGRLDVYQMADVMKQEGMGPDDLIVDATHPYATDVTKNIKEATGLVGAKYVRVIRKEADVSFDHKTYESVEQCAKALDKTDGNILLTTGSKELNAYCKNVSKDTKERTYVRVLPVPESLDLCIKESISPKNIIAMQGPFGKEMNMAVMKQYDIRHLVTKESGSVGGFEEKIRAAGELSITCHVIKRPQKEEGKDIYDVYRMITSEEYKIKRSIILAGLGMGSDKNLTYEVKTAIEEVDAVFGAKRVIDRISAKKKYDMYLAGNIIPVLENDKSIQKSVILFSGDSGMYSGTKAMSLALGKWDKEADIRILPGISSVSYLSSLTGLSYDDAKIFSIHGRKDSFSMNELIQTVRYSKKTFVLLSGDEDIRDIGNELLQLELKCEIYVGIDMSYEDEKLIKLSEKEAASFYHKGIMTALIVNEENKKRPLINVLNDEEFIRDKVPMTKECVRHESIIRLSLSEGDVVYDIGGGTGSVAIEAAAIHPSLKIYSFEKNDTAYELMLKNIEKHHAMNVIAIKGEAPQSLKDIEAPDCVFIGGSSHMLSPIIDEIKKKKRGVRYVINAVSLETIDEVRGMLKEHDTYDLIFG